jgi:hypothetical protein
MSAFGMSPVAGQSAGFNPGQARSIQPRGQGTPYGQQRQGRGWDPLAINRELQQKRAADNAAFSQYGQRLQSAGTPEERDGIEYDYQVSLAASNPWLGLSQSPSNQSREQYIEAQRAGRQTQQYLRAAYDADQASQRQAFEQRMSQYARPAGMSDAAFRYLVNNQGTDHWLAPTFSVWQELNNRKLPRQTADAGYGTDISPGLRKMMKNEMDAYEDDVKGARGRGLIRGGAASSGVRQWSPWANILQPRRGS